MDWNLEERRLELEVEGLRLEIIVHSSLFIVHRSSLHCFEVELDV